MSASFLTLNFERGTGHGFCYTALPLCVAHCLDLVRSHPYCSSALYRSSRNSSLCIPAMTPGRRRDLASIALGAASSLPGLHIISILNSQTKLASSDMKVLV